MQCAQRIQHATLTVHEVTSLFTISGDFAAVEVRNDGVEA